jgi:hypothetical protein
MIVFSEFPAARPLAVLLSKAGRTWPGAAGHGFPARRKIRLS